MKKVSVLICVCAMLTLSAPVISQANEMCPLCEAHTQAQPKGPVPYSGKLVCIRGMVAGPAKVTVHFLGPDGKEYRSAPHTGIFNGHWKLMVGRHWFERVKREGGIVRVCAGHGEIGVRFEERNIVEHLANGSRCDSEPICLFPGLRCAVGQ